MKQHSAGDELVIQRAKKSTAGTVLLLQHYPGKCPRDIFENALPSWRKGTSDFIRFQIKNESSNMILPTLLKSSDRSTFPSGRKGNSRWHLLQMMTASNSYKSLSPKLASGVFRYSILHHMVVLYRVGIQIHTLKYNDMNLSPVVF